MTNQNFQSPYRLVERADAAQRQLPATAADSSTDLPAPSAPTTPRRSALDSILRFFGFSIMGALLLITLVLLAGLWLMNDTARGLFTRASETTVINGGARDRSVAHVPVELRSPAAVEAQRLNGGQPAWDRDMDVLNAPYALLSAGESDEVDAQGNPVPRFGDISNPRSPFDPSSLDDNTFRTLMQDLQSNVRYIP